MFIDVSLYSFLQAAPGYYAAKQIIKLIVGISEGRLLLICSYHYYLSLYVLFNFSLKTNLAFYWFRIKLFVFFCTQTFLGSWFGYSMVKYSVATDSQILLSLLDI